jgi:hypothetical protein
MRSYIQATVLCLSALVAAVPTVNVPSVSAGDCCCHHCRHRCGHCCCNCGGNESHGGPISKAADGPIFNRAPLVQAPIIQATPLFAMPVMYAGMPMMGGVSSPSPKDVDADTKHCEERLDNLERQVSDLATSINNLQTIVNGQTELLKAIVEAKK